MIKAHTDHHTGEVAVTLNGTLQQFCADTCAIVHAIYEGIMEHDEDAAKLYRETMEAKLVELAFSSSAELQEKLDEQRAHDASAKDSLMQTLRDLAEALQKTVEGADDD